MGSVVTAPAPVLPGLADEGYAARLLASFQIEEVGRDVTLDRMPAKDERELLQSMNVNLVRKLRRCDMATADLQTARRNLAVMFGGIPSLRNANVDDLLNAYLLVLQSYPLFAIELACGDVAHGRISNVDPNYPPTSAVVARRCADYVAKVATDQMRIEKILRAQKVMRPPSADGSGERVMASLQDFHGRLAGAVLLGHMTPEEKRAAHGRQRERQRLGILKEWADLDLTPVYTAEGLPMTVAMAKQTGRII